MLWRITVGQREGVMVQMFLESQSSDTISVCGVGLSHSFDFGCAWNLLASACVGSRKLRRITFTCVLLLVCLFLCESVSAILTSVA